MNIRPTTIGCVNTAKNKIAVYDTAQQKPVLVFSSALICAKYLFGHLIFSVNDLKNFRTTVSRYSKTKQTEDKNIFGKRLAYRTPPDYLIKELNDQDFVVLDEQFFNNSFNQKISNKIRFDSYDLEDVLEVGDLVEFKYGANKGYATEVLDIKCKNKGMTPGSKYYTLKVNGVNNDFKANILSLVVSKKSIQ